MKRFAVFGLGNFGFHVAKTLYEDGHEVIALDKSRETIQLVEDYSTEALVMDFTDRKSLEPLGLDEVDAAVVSTGDDTNASILTTLYLTEFGVKKILVKATDEDHAKVLERVGATEVIFVESTMAVKVAKSLSTANILDMILLSQEYNIIELAPPGSFVGKSLKELNLRAKYHVHVIAIQELVPENFVLVPHADFVIKDSDLLIMIGKSEDIKKIREIV